MTSPELLHELRSSRPSAPPDVRARVREIAAGHSALSPWPRLRVPVRRTAFVLVPAAAALALASAGVLGIARSGGTTQTIRDDRAGEATRALAPESTETLAGEKAPAPAQGVGASPQDSAIGPTPGRAERVSATLTVEVADSDAVSRAAQDVLDLTRSLGGHVVSASVATGEEGSASLLVRVPVTKVQEAIVQLSALGRIASQEVRIEDLQEGLDANLRRERSVRAQIAVLVARLDSESLDPETRARLEQRLRNLRGELRALRQTIAGTRAEARLATIQVTVATPGVLGAAPTAPSRLDRTVEEAFDVLVWEAVVALAVAIVAAPFALLLAAMWAGRRLYRRREEERLLAT